MKKKFLLLLLCLLSMFVYAASSDTTLVLNRMTIADKKVVREIKRNVSEIRNAYNITATSDTFLICFYCLDKTRYFSIIAKNKQKVSKYEIPATEILGYSIIKDDVFIICGEENELLFRKKKDNIEFILYDFPPIFDGYPPCWIFKIEDNTIKLIEKYMPKEKNYHIKFP